MAAYAKEAGLATALATNGTLIDSSMALKIAQAGFWPDCGESGWAVGGNSRPDSRPGGLFRRGRCRHHGGEVGERHGADQYNGFAVEFKRVAGNAGTGKTVASCGLARIYIRSCRLRFGPACGRNADGRTGGKKTLHWLFEVSQRSEIQIKPTCAPQYYRILAQHGGLKPGTMWHRYTRGCLAGINVCFVSATGKIFPCGYLPTLAGDLRQESLEQIWHNSKIFKDLRDITLLKGRCGVCSDVAHCGGCRARAFSVSGDFLAEDPGCQH